MGNVQEKGTKKTRTGTVLSDRMTKTVVVECERTFRHPIYRKVVRSVSKFYAHDEKQEAKKGDTVRIVECRPYSKKKRWYMAQVVKKVGQAKVDVSDLV